LEEKRISRREMLRNVGIAGAVAWAAPVLTSLPASASVDKCKKKKAKKLCKGQNGNCTNGFVQCGSCSNGNLSGAFCFSELGTGTNYCGTNSYCSQISTCSSSADCKGGVCITSNGCTGCGSSSGVCVPRCCVGLARPAGTKHMVKRLGRTTAG
jgi:hypothetical protein